MGKMTEVYDMLIDVASASEAVVEEALIGLNWTLCRADGLGIAMSPAGGTRTLPWSGSLTGRPIKALAPWLRSWQPFEASVGMAAVNAAINRELILPRDAVPLSGDGPGNLVVFEHFLPMLRGKKVAVVGHYPGLERYMTMLDMSVLERTPAAGDLPDPAAEFVLPDAEWVFLTASTLTNKTFPRLAELSRDATLVLMGPTVPWVDELAAFGVDFLAGVRVEDPDILWPTVAEGGGTRIFDAAVQYQVLDLGLSQMERTKAAIAEVVVRREQLKREMEAWYAGPWRGSFPRAFELDAMERELSELDTRFKRMWDSRHPRVAGQAAYNNPHSDCAAA